MGYASTSVASGRCARGSSCSSLRSHLAAGGAVASAGILALSLVAAPPDFNGARTELRAVQLAALALPTAASPAAILEQFISNQANTAVPAAAVVPGGAAVDITTAAVTTPTAVVTAPLNVDPAINGQQVNNTAAAATTAAFDWGTFLQDIYN